jgi:RND family efflux transporter MFP subunit
MSDVRELVTGFGRSILGSTLAAATLLPMLAGCQRTSSAASPQSQAAVSHAGVSVRIVRPERKTIRHAIEQPGFNIEAFEETPLYAKISGYVREWKVDIGAPVRKGQVLATLYVPEMEVDVKQKEAAVGQAKAQIRQAEAAVLTARAQAARAQSQYERLSRTQGVLSQEDVAESRLGYEAAQAGVEKANADVAAANAQLKVAQAAQEFAQTMLGYATIKSPFDGVVTQRNVNTDDFIQPAGMGGKHLPLFVVDRIDPARVFLNLPGTDALWIRDGDPVTLRLQGAGGQVFQGTITRNARALDPRTRTLRTEIDIPNPERKLLPGMYVQATILIQHANVWTLPAAAVITEGDQAYCYRVVDGKAVRTNLQTGLTGGGLVEVQKKQVTAAAANADSKWSDITGDEEIIVGDPAALSPGQSVQVNAQKN